MKKVLITILAIGFIATIFVGCGDYSGTYEQRTEKGIILSARRASVQPLFYVPIVKVSFAMPLEEEKKIETVKDLEEYLKDNGLGHEGIIKKLEERDLTREKLEKLMTERITFFIEAERLKQSVDKYETVLTTMEKWGYNPPSRTAIPLGAFCPTWAKFPERVLVVYKTEKTNINAYEEKYKKDILSISELANVSPTTAKGIVNRLSAEGYTISKEQVDTTAQVTLLWFRNGWDDVYPRSLDWRVSLHGEKENIITGYDPRGILETRTVPEGKTIDVIAGYFDLKPEHKPKTNTVQTLEREIKQLQDSLIVKDEVIKKREEMIEEKIKEIDKIKEEQKEDKGITKRDITIATWDDVRYGYVKLEQLWMIEGGTGTYLGDMKVTDKFTGKTHAWGGFFHDIKGIEKSVILTNAHVAQAAMSFDTWVSEDKEVMWLISPGIPYIRFTQDSDMWGTPAQLLCYDDTPILSHDYDAAVLVTTKIPGLNKYKAILGDSNKVEQGDSIVMVGNPSLLQKFATKGIVSNKDYNFLKDQTWHWFPKDIPHSVINSWINCSLWYDSIIGIGGTSGSGVWSLEGPEKGKVIGLHAMGLGQPLSIAMASDEGIVFDINSLDKAFKSSLKIQDTIKDVMSLIFKNYSHKDAKFRFSAEDMAKSDSTFKEAMHAKGRWVDITGMHAGIPINKVKMYLQERGLDPELFGTDRLGSSHWEK